MVNALFTAAIILHAQLARIDTGQAARCVEGALEHLDQALHEIRRAALVRQRDTAS